MTEDGLRQEESPMRGREIDFSGIEEPERYDPFLDNAASLIVTEKEDGELRQRVRIRDLDCDVVLIRSGGGEVRGLRKPILIKGVIEEKGYERGFVSFRVRYVEPDKSAEQIIAPTDFSNTSEQAGGGVVRNFEEFMLPVTEEICQQIANKHGVEVRQRLGADNAEMEALAESEGFSEDELIEGSKIAELMKIHKPELKD